MDGYTPGDDLNSLNYPDQQTSRPLQSEIIPVEVAMNYSDYGGSASYQDHVTVFPEHFTHQAPAMEGSPDFAQPYQDAGHTTERVSVLVPIEDLVAVNNPTSALLQIIAPTLESAHNDELAAHPEVIGGDGSNFADLMPIPVQFSTPQDIATSGYPAQIMEASLNEGQLPMGYLNPLGQPQQSQMEYAVDFVGQMNVEGRGVGQPQEEPEAVRREYFFGSQSQEDMSLAGVGGVQFRDIVNTVMRCGSNSKECVGVSQHKKSGRFEAHLWVQQMGKQIYLGGFDTQKAAACAYDICALKKRGDAARTNFKKELYTPYRDWITRTHFWDLVSSARRISPGFARGQSQYRGVTYHNKGRWEARIGVCPGRHLYLGVYDQEKEAAIHYDRALVRLKGRSATPNFSIQIYGTEVHEHFEMEQLLGSRGFPPEDANAITTWIKTGVIPGCLR